MRCAFWISMLGAMGCSSSTPPKATPSEPLSLATPDGTLRFKEGCRVGALVADPDPAGLNVRAAPNSKSKVQGTLPQHSEVSLIDAKGAWLRVGEVFHQEHEERKDWPLGWVHSSMLTTALKTAPEYGPDFQPRLYELAGEEADSIVFPTDPHTLSILTCTDLFLHVRIDYGTLRPALTGWLFVNDHCPSTVSTCS